MPVLSHMGLWQRFVQYPHTFHLIAIVCRKVFTKSLRTRWCKTLHIKERIYTLGLFTYLSFCQHR